MLKRRMVVGKMKTPNQTNSNQQKTKMIKLLKKLSLRKRFEKTHNSSYQLETIIGLKYKQKKGWSLSDLFNIKQRNKEVDEERKTAKDDSYVGPDDILPPNLLLDPPTGAGDNRVKTVEEKLVQITQKSLSAVIQEAKSELARGGHHSNHLLLDCNYVPLENISRAVYTPTLISQSPFISDYVDMRGSG